MPSKQMVKDINGWSTDKLEQWYNDSMMRYDMIGLDGGEAFTQATMTLVTGLGKLLADHTDVAPEQAGIAVAHVVRLVRQQREQVKRNKT